MRAHRQVLTALAGLALACGGLAATTLPATAADTDIKINEVESSGGVPGDWIELTNTSSTNSVNVSNWVLKDNDDTRTFAIPNNTTIAPGGYLAVDVDVAGGFGLGEPDSARVYLPGGTTLIDSYSWTSHAATTYGRCPDRTGAFITTGGATKGFANNCAAPPAAPNPGTTWPGGATVTTVDPASLFTTGDASGLYYEGSGSSATGTLWAVENNPSLLYKLTRSGGTWGPATGWETPRQMQYPGGGGVPDSEGITMTDAGAAGGAFIATERDNSVGGTSRPAILRVSTTGASPLVATNDWNLTADLPGLGANAGLEGITWVPDTALTARGFRTAAGAVYDPTAYPNHGSGLFFVGVEATGAIYAYALDLTSNAYTRVATFASGLQKTAGGSAVMELTWEPATQRLWAVCDNDCTGQSSPFVIGASGSFAAVDTYGRPAGMPNINNEGFALAPHSECVNGAKPVFWLDDGDTDSFSLREGTITCAGPPAALPAPTTPTTPITPAPPVVERIAPAVRIIGAKAGKTYPKKRRNVRCVAVDASGIRSCVVTTSKKRKGAVTKVKLVATAVDNAGNTATARVTYKVRKRR